MTVDQLGEYGVDRMGDDEVEGFLSSQSLGVLGLPAEGEPYLLPMSYGYGGGGRLYFFYVAGEGSRKADLTRRAETASFLVYSAETAFIWRSVLLTGTIQKLPEEKRATLRRDQSPTWRPELFKTASEAEGTQLYEFRIEDWTGIKQTDLPPAFYQGSRSDDPE